MNIMNAMATEGEKTTPCIVFLVLMSSMLIVEPVEAEIELLNGTNMTLPGAQGWLYFTDPPLFQDTTLTLINNAMRLDSTPDITESAGLFNNLHPTSPVLDRDAGFIVRYDVRIDTEIHSSTNRAGFSVIVISSDTNAVEIGMWTNEVWAQSDTPLFNKAESTLFDTTSGTNRYEIEMYRDRYEVRANGVVILEGPVRDYTAFAGAPDPYENPNFIFLGDDTSSASALFDLAYVSVSLIPHLELIDHTPTSVCLMVSNLETGLTYHVDRSSGLTSQDWSMVELFIPTSATAKVSVALEGDATNAHYRVKAVP